ncbi:hypothetical protein BC834DRAFT_921278 [Gloeopeniophorella convolvens]|nr:hypothetical protein BC834DRAFT_921278 [Gloeopeniophorella convolvens]
MSVTVAVMPSGAPSLVDIFGRRHNYLRISLTERCNLRCFYCMPSEGVQLSPNSDILTDDEIIRLATLFVRSGVTKIRLTGGEPTVRKNIVGLVSRLSGLREHGLESIGMTTNGLVLHRYLDDLISNGLTHVNISLDTLDPFKFEIMTRRMGHEAVMRSLQMALKSSYLRSVKLNVVVIRGLNDTEVPDFVEMTRDQALSVRFIEFMPFTGNKWNKSKMVPSSELLAAISSQYHNLAKTSDEPNDTARSYRVPGYRGSIGFISSMSDHFCGSCNRLRLTADGQIKVCLFDAKEVSLRDQMRRGADDAELLGTVEMAVQGKKEKHAGMDAIDVITNRPMILIGEPSSPRLTHIDAHGKPSMVNVSPKEVTSRSATASGRIYLPRAAYDLVSPEAANKGDVLLVAQLAAIMACKRTADLIPLCHPLPLTHVEVKLVPQGNAVPGARAYSVLCEATVRCEGRTGVEMEALTAVSVGLLTVWDMLKAVAGREMLIGDILVANKTGGKGGDFSRSA